MKNRKSLFSEPLRRVGKRRKMRDFTKPVENSENAAGCVLIFVRNQWKKYVFKKKHFNKVFFDTVGLPVTYGVSGNDSESIYRNNASKIGSIS
jgi:hypothetical protein